MDFIMPVITMLGNGAIIWIAVAAVMLAIKRYRKCGITLLIGLLAGFLIGDVIMKNLIARPRPCWLDQSVELLIANPTSYSFPSGHTLSSSTAATILIRTNRKFAIFAVPAASLISFSRLYLHVHFLSDVLGGVCIGILTGSAVFSICRTLFQKLEKGKENSITRK